MSDTLFNIRRLASGIDTESIIEALVTVAKVPINRYKNQQLEITWKQEAWDNIKTKLNDLQAALSILTDRNNIVTKKRYLQMNPSSQYQLPV